MVTRRRWSAAGGRPTGATRSPELGQINRAAAGPATGRITARLRPIRSVAMAIRLEFWFSSMLCAGESASLLLQPLQQLLQMSFADLYLQTLAYLSGRSSSDVGSSSPRSSFHFQRIARRPARICCSRPRAGAIVASCK